MNDTIDIPVQAFNALMTGYEQLINKLQDDGHEIQHIITVGLYALGSAIAQAGGEIPEDLLLKDFDPFRDGFRSGLVIVSMRGR